MSALTNDEFAARVLEVAGRPPEQFIPTAYHDLDGDCIEFLASPDNFYAERVLTEQPFVKDDKITVGKYAEQNGMTEADWQKIDILLHQSWRSLWHAVNDAGSA